MKSRKVKAIEKSKRAFVSKNKMKGNIPLDTFSDSDADVDSRELLYDERRDGKDNDLSTDDELIRHEEEASEEEEVLAITDDEKEDSEEDYQMEEGEDSEDDEHGLPSKEVWGKRKKTYYSADFVDEDRGRTYREEDAEKARLEAEEAYAMQMSVSSVAANYATEMLKFEFVNDTIKEEKPDEIDLDSLDPKMKLKLLKKKFPECFLYINEFHEKSIECREKIVPLLGLINENKNLPEGFADYIKVKYQILLHYCMNMSFYMILKSRGTDTANHPVIQRINSFKNLLDSFDGNERFSQEVEVITSKLKNNEMIHFANGNKLEDIAEHLSISENSPTKSQTKSKKDKKLKEKNTDAEKEIFSLYMDLQNTKKEKDTILEETNLDAENTPKEDTVTEEKRTITYQIAKNKGLTAKRKKELRNPRVHNKMKFRKAQIRRKGQVRNVIREVTRYAGEPTGISAHVVKSRKLK